MRLLGELLNSGGLAVECAGTDGASRARLLLQPDGSTFLRCTGIDASLPQAVAASITCLSGRIAAAAATVAALRTLADVLVLCTALSAALALSAASGTAWEAVGRPVLVAAAYGSLVPLRGPLLRVILRQALRLAFKPER